MLIPALSLIGGLILLVVASDWLVEGAVGIARRFGMSMMVVGLTVVAYGTSFPEFVVSTLAALQGGGEFAIGNVVGSNIANIGLVLGAAAIIKPFSVGGGSLFRRDIPFLLLATGAGLAAINTGEVLRWHGIILLFIAFAFTVACVKTPAIESGTAAEDDADPVNMPKSIALLIVGGAGLFGGAHFMVEGGTAIAQAYGISERVIALTIVAIGTSLPELAASVAGAMKGYPELAVGNVVGSCLFNLSFVMGSASVITPLGVDPSTMRIDLIVVGALTIGMWFIFLTGRRVARMEGGLLLLSYGSYLTWLVVSTVKTLG